MLCALRARTAPPMRLDTTVTCGSVKEGKINPETERGMHQRQWFALMEGLQPYLNSGRRTFNEWLGGGLLNAKVRIYGKGQEQSLDPETSI